MKNKSYLTWIQYWQYLSEYHSQLQRNKTMALFDPCFTSIAKRSGRLSAPSKDYMLLSRASVNVIDRRHSPDIDHRKMMCRKAWCEVSAELQGSPSVSFKTYTENSKISGDQKPLFVFVRFMMVAVITLKSKGISFRLGQLVKLVN